MGPTTIKSSAALGKYNVGNDTKTNTQTIMNRFESLRGALGMLLQLWMLQLLCEVFVWKIMECKYVCVGGQTICRICQSMCQALAF